MTQSELRRRHAKGLRQLLGLVSGEIEANRAIRAVSGL